jgi:two-component system phosphate regulon sensor histidine kinase PhoR
MKRSIFFKVFGGYVVLLLSLAALFLWFSYGTIKKYYLETLVRDLERLGRSLAVEVSVYLDGDRLPDLGKFLVDEEKKIEVRLTVIAADGTVLADSERNAATMENHRYRPEVFEALEGRTGHALRHSDTINQDMLYVALPLRKSGRVEAALRLSLFVKDIDVLLHAIRRNLAEAGAIILALSLLAAFVFSRNLTRPARELSLAARRVAAGDFDVRVRPRIADEWKDLAQSFNFMTQEIKTLFVGLKQKKEELDNIMAEMEEGLLVLDKTGRIVLSNASARAFMAQPAVDGKFYWEVVRASPFVELVRRVADERKSSLAEVVLDEKNILCRASYLPSEGGVVVTLHDITEMQNLAKIKRDFVLNVSHELRTPLTAIRGYAETLESEVDESNRAYVGIVLKHTDRLIKIVEDLLVLSTLEEEGAPLQVEDVNLGEIVENVIKIFAPRAKQKNLELVATIDERLPAIAADGFRIEQMLVNLVDNAIKYTEKGRVEVVVKRGEGGVVIEVSDTGIGIPDEDRDRVFERFYVVDKSRSRTLGGTGLGLSIVKHIVSLHGGRIQLRSTPGAGSTFTIVLPLKRDAS